MASWSTRTILHKPSAFAVENYTTLQSSIGKHSRTKLDRSKGSHPSVLKGSAYSAMPDLSELLLIGSTSIGARRNCDIKVIINWTFVATDTTQQEQSAVTNNILESLTMEQFEQLKNYDR